MNTELKCPKCTITLKRKPIVWGLVGFDEGWGDVIFGGCCIPEKKYKYGYSCPACEKSYYIDSSGKLISLH